MFTGEMMTGCPSLLTLNTYVHSAWHASARRYSRDTASTTTSARRISPSISVHQSFPSFSPSCSIHTS